MINAREILERALRGTQYPPDPKPTQAAIIATIVGGLFLDSIGTKVARSMKK